MLVNNMAVLGDRIGNSVDNQSINPAFMTTIFECRARCQVAAGSGQE
jgi:hypothetical protein